MNANAIFCFLLSFGMMSGLIFEVGAMDHLTFEGKEGPGSGKHVVLLAGDEEYRSEEGLPMLARILSERHGFRTTVCFSLNEKGEIDPKAGGSLSHPEALDDADAIVLLLRFRHWNDATTERFEAAMKRGVPVIGLRTSTHAFNYPKDGRWGSWTWNSAGGGWGRKVLGETWVSHWGKHKVEATQGVVEPGAEQSPLLRGVTAVFGDSDVYEAHPPEDVKVLLRGLVLEKITADSAPAKQVKKTVKGTEQAVNEPMMPIAWTRELEGESGVKQKVFCTTMGAATDLLNEGLRRLVVNAVYWGVGLEVPERASVDWVGKYEPTAYGFDGFKKGKKPADMVQP